MCIREKESERDTISLAQLASQANRQLELDVTKYIFHLNNSVILFYFIPLKLKLLTDLYIKHNISRLKSPAFVLNSQVMLHVKQVIFYQKCFF